MKIQVDSRDIEDALVALSNYMPISETASKVMKVKLLVGLGVKYIEAVNEIKLLADIPAREGDTLISLTPEQEKIEQQKTTLEFEEEDF